MSSKSDKDKDGDTSQLRKLGLFAVILSELIGYTGAGIGIGYYLWAKWHAPWWVLLLSCLLGLTLAFYQLYQLTKKDI
jgi:F0F1-type ATP synthase assembly protein I